MRIIPKQEIFIEAKSSLAGKCAMRLYYDGNITFSHQASELLNFENNRYFEIVENAKGDVFIMPNDTSGYKVTKRKGKHCFLIYSKPIINYLSKRFSKQVVKGIGLEFLIKSSKNLMESTACFKLEIVDKVS